MKKNNKIFQYCNISCKKLELKNLAIITRGEDYLESDTVN